MRRIGNLINKEEELCKVYTVHDCISIISMLAQAKYSGSNYLYKNVERMLNISLVDTYYRRKCKKEDERIFIYTRCNIEVMKY